MKSWSDLTIRANWVPALVFLVALGCGEALVHFGNVVHRQRVDFSTNRLISRYAIDIQNNLSSALASTYILEQELIRNDGVFADFDGFAQTVLNQLPNVANLQLAPDGVISQIYPLVGNEAAIGHDILRDDQRRTDAWSAVESRDLTLAGPFPLKQGGIGMVGRNPVFLELEGGRVFWGFASALILLEDLLAGIDIATLSSQDHAYQFSRTDPDSGATVIFASNELALPADPVTVEVKVPNGSWALSAASLERGTPLGTILGHLVSILIAFLLAMIARRSIVEPENLRNQVLSKTIELEAIAYLDALTGLPNRRKFCAHMQELIELGSTGHSVPHLMLMDIDHFKEVNDSLGHEVGDQLLIRASERIRDCLPASAVLSRLGGDEFTITIADDMEDADVERVATRIVDALGHPFVFGDDEAHVSASIGIAVFGDTDPTVKDMLKAADTAMYEAKKTGKARFVRYADSMRSRIARTTGLGSDLRRAIAKGELELVYQPITNAATDRVEKAEGLLRWNHPVLGAISPLEFIPIAEQTGQILVIGEWVFKTAACMSRQWQAQYQTAVQVSINISPVQLRCESHVRKLIDHTRSIGLRDTGVLLEITEGIFLQNNKEIRRNLGLLHDAGMELALDDFGTGYCSLSYLKSFDIEYLKIDRSFVRNLPEHDSDMALCQAMISIARSFGLRVVAEGVETIEQSRVLQAEGCDFIQGYLISRPVCASQFEQEFLRQPDQALNLDDDDLLRKCA